MPQYVLKLYPLCNVFFPLDDVERFQVRLCRTTLSYACDCGKSYISIFQRHRRAYWIGNLIKMSLQSDTFGVLTTKPEVGMCTNNLSIPLAK